MRVSQININKTYRIIYVFKNKYNKWYQNIINDAKETPRRGYTEKHHIIPKSLGGSSSSSNLVALTAKEHFVCHRLLTKMTLGKDRKKMLCAVWAFIRCSKHQQRVHINGRTYSRVRSEFALALSQERKGKMNVGKQASAEARLKMSLASKGIPKSQLTKDRMKSAWTKRPDRSPAHCEALSKALSGRVLSEATKQKMSTTKKGITPVHTLIPFVCEHCGRSGVGAGNYKRWHGDNCRKKNE